MQNKKRELRYSIRKLKSGVGAVLIGTVLLGGQLVMTNTRPVVSAENNQQTANNIPSVDKMREIYKKIIELVESERATYKASFEDSIGSKLKQLFETSNTPAETLHNTLLYFTSYGLVINYGSPIQFATLAEFEPYLEKDYKDELQKQKDAQKDVVSKSGASEEIKEKYSKLLEAAQTLTAVRKDIPNQFTKEVAQAQRKVLQESIDKAKDEINQLHYLKNRDKYQKLLDMAASQEEINTHLEMARKEAETDKKDHEAVDKIQKEINALEHLTSEEKSQYNGVLDTSTPADAQKLLEEAQKKNISNYIDKLIALADSAKKQLVELDELPPVPETDEYSVQNKLWEQLRKIGNDTIAATTKQKLEGKDANALKIRYVNLMDFIYYIKIESMTRQVAVIRQKYPDNRKINELFNNNLKQTDSNNYASQSGSNLKHYVEDEMINAFNKIKHISSNLDKKAEVSKQIDDLIDQISGKPQTEALINELERAKGLINYITDDIEKIESLLNTHFNSVKKKVEEYEKAYKTYTDSITKGLEQLKTETDRLRALKHEKINQLADTWQQEGEVVIKASEIFGEKSYQVVIPAAIEKVKKQVDEFIANYRPLTPLTPSVVVKTEVETQEMAYDTKEVKNPNLPKGERRVKVQGQKGTRTITYKVRRQGDKVLSREKVSEVVTKAPVTEIIEIGTKESQPDVPKPERPKTPLIPLTPSIVEKTETETQEINYMSQEVKNPNLPKGERRVTVQGQKGTRTITYKVRRQGDKILSREKVSEVVTKVPVTEIIEIGTKESQPDVPKPEKPTRPLTPLTPSIVEKTEIETQEIGYTSQEVKNPDLPKGERRVTVQGKKGVRTVTYKVRRQGDKILSREIISEAITEAPITEIIEVGTKASEMQNPKTPKSEKSESKDNKQDKQVDKTLPHTGEKDSSLVGIAGAIMAALGLFGVRRRTKTK